MAKFKGVVTIIVKIIELFKKLLFIPFQKSFKRVLKQAIIEKLRLAGRIFVFPEE